MHTYRHISCAQTWQKPSHPPPPMQCRYWFSCSVCWWRGVEGDGRGMWDGTPVGLVCVCVFVWAAAVCLLAPLTGEKASAISVSVVLPLRLPVFCLSSFSLLSLQKPLPCPPPPLCPLCRQKAGVSALPHQVRHSIFPWRCKHIIFICSWFIAWKMQCNWGVFIAAANTRDIKIKMPSFLSVSVSSNRGLISNQCSLCIISPIVCKHSNYSGYLLLTYSSNWVKELMLW